jgi:hypothetical protein
LTLAAALTRLPLHQLDHPDALFHAPGDDETRDSVV